MYRKTDRHFLFSMLALLLLTLATIPARAVTIMSMGDSITVGADYFTHSAGGYRDPLYWDLASAGISFSFVGVNGSNATPALTAAGETFHNGYGSWHIQDIDNNLDGSAAPTWGGDSNLGGYFVTGGHGTGRPAVSPDILLLHIGTNDLLQGTQNINQNLSYLVTHFHALSPATTILIAGIIPINDAGLESAIQTYNSYIKNTLVTALPYTRYVDQNSSFLNSDGSVNGALLGADKVHPNRFGYPIIAANWAKAIKTFLGVSGTNHALTVNGGTGSGSYPSGAIVTINANPAATGAQFGAWTPGTTALSNPYSSVTTYIMPSVAATLTATNATAGAPVVPNGTYNISSYYDGLSIAASGSTNASLSQQQTYTGAATQRWDLTNLGGNAVTLTLAGTSKALEVPFASAGVLGANLDVSDYTGGSNQQWVVTPTLGTTQIINSASGQAINIQGYATTSGAQLVQYTAGYIFNQLWDFFPVSGSTTSYALTVSKGSGSGNYAAGTTVSITAAAAGSGYQFAGWTGATGALANPSSATTTVTMPAAATLVAATYCVTSLSYPLTVNSGTRSGSYPAGSAVTVTANPPANGYHFLRWTGAAATLQDPSASATTLTMPAAATSITATYSQAGGAPSTVGVQFIGGGAAPLHGRSYDYTAGAGSFSAGNWNPVLDSGNTTSPQSLTLAGGLMDSNGASTSIGFHLASSGAFYTGAGSGFTSSPPYPGYSAQTSGAGDAFLYAGFAYAGYSDARPATLSITGLKPGNKYDLLIYVSPFEQFGNKESATLSLTGGPTYYIDTNGSTGTYQRVTSTSRATSTQGNYVEFDNLTGSTSQTLTLINTSSMVGISGFQVVDLGAAASGATYLLTVNKGNGSGSYPAGASVNVTADTPPSGYQFAGWTGATSTLANAKSASTSLIMGAVATSITATYSQVMAAVSTTVGVQFIGGGAAPLHGGSYDYTAGAGSFSQGQWNPVLDSGNSTAIQDVIVTSGLNDSTGVSSPIGFHLISSGAYYTGAGKGFSSSPLYPGYSTQLSGPGDAFLFAGFAYAGYSDASPSTLTVTGLKSGNKYDLLVYVSPFEALGNNQTATATLTGGPTYYINTDAGTGTYARITSTAAGTTTPGNYVEFDDLTGSTTQTLTMTNTSSMVGISGFQVVDLGAY